MCPKRPAVVTRSFTLRPICTRRVSCRYTGKSYAPFVPQSDMFLINQVQLWAAAFDPSQPQPMPNACRAACIEAWLAYCAALSLDAGWLEGRRLPLACRPPCCLPARPPVRRDAAGLMRTDSPLSPQLPPAALPSHLPTYNLFPADRCPCRPSPTAATTLAWTQSGAATAACVRRRRLARAAWPPRRSTGTS